jgi:methionyl-tRNA formyltransferase
VRIVFAATPQPAVPSLRALLDSQHDVVAVISRPDAPTGRGRRLTASPVSEIARQAGIELLTPVSANDPEFVSRLRELAPDCAAVVAYGAILRQEVLDIPTHGWVNLHFSLLPAWRGAAPVQAAIRAGDDITGATAFRLEAGLDTGPVYGLVTEAVRPTDTAGELLERLSVSGARLLVATMDGIADGSVTALPQAVEGVSQAPKISAADAEVDWRLPAAVIDRLVRSVTPGPGAWTESPWGRLVLGPVQAVNRHNLRPGELAAAKSEVLVGTGSGAVRLGTVQAPGKRPMAAADWARGARPQPGTILAAHPANGAVDSRHRSITTEGADR